MLLEEICIISQESDENGDKKLQEFLCLQVTGLIGKYFVKLRDFMKNYEEINY